ncbi:sodium channel subunit beta-4 [Malurus melanocephalus]|uniref:sodium channel subunit beta-4 n=1 Tax=Malurus melanocephalus TaxID=175006 RepID=UPI0025467BF8|nr:sodium channel subunit beta-4 [Malurus melanocephalus]
MCIRFLSRAIPILMGCNGTFGMDFCMCRADFGLHQETMSLSLTQEYPADPTPCPFPPQIYHGKIKNKATEPTLISRNPRVEFVGSTTKKDNNISIVLNGVEFSDAGKYTCHVKNPKEKNAQHNATIFLTVVHKMVETDNTVTLIIVSVVGGLIGLLILFMLIKRVVLFIIKKTQDGKKECLVSSSGNDNTENGLAGSKAEQKAPPKA